MKIKTNLILLLNENELRNYESNFGQLKNQTLRDKFDNKLKSMLKNAQKAEQRSKLEERNDALMKLRGSPFYDNVSKTENKAFIAFVKGQSNFERFCRENEHKLLNICNGLISCATFDQKKEHLKQKYGSHLCIVYLMKVNWHCDKIGMKIKEKEQTECQKYRKYLDIFYQYLFNLQNEDDDPVKAINSALLIRKVEKFGTLIDVVKHFSLISEQYLDLKLKKSAISMENLEEIFNSEKEIEEITEELLEEQFDGKMKEVCKSAGKMVSQNEEAMKNWWKRNAVLNDKFGTLFESPFYGTIAHYFNSG